LNTDFMKAMIFAAGLGTRLKPLTDSMPKALVPIGGKPLLQHIIEKLSNAGFKEIVINVHHFPEQIIRFLRDNDNFGLHIEVSDESDKLLDTGGGIRKASAFLKGDTPFLVHNVDILSNADLGKLYDSHTRQEEMATLLVSQRKTSRYLLFDEQYMLKGWINDSTDEVKSPYPVSHRKNTGGLHLPEFRLSLPKFSTGWKICRINFLLLIFTSLLLPT